MSEWHSVKGVDRDFWKRQATQVRDAGTVEAAAGKRGVRRGLWVCFPERRALTQGGLAQARHALGCDRPHLWC